MKVVTTVRIGKMIAANDRPIAKAPIPICKALTQLGDLTSVILVLVVRYSAVSYI